MNNGHRIKAALYLVGTLLLSQWALTVIMFFRFGQQAAVRDQAWLYLISSYIAVYLVTITVAAACFLLRWWWYSLYFAFLHFSQLVAAQLFSLDFIASFDYLLALQFVSFTFCCVYLYRSVTGSSFKADSVFAIFNAFFEPVNQISKGRVSYSHITLVIAILALLWQAMVVLPGIWQKHPDFMGLVDLLGFFAMGLVVFSMFKGKKVLPLMASSLGLYLYAHNDAVTSVFNLPYFLLTARQVSTLPAAYWAEIVQQLVSLVLPLLFYSFTFLDFRRHLQAR